MILFAELALTPKGWTKIVRVILDRHGRISFSRWRTSFGAQIREIAPGNCADLLTLDSVVLTLCGRNEDEILDRWIFSVDVTIVSNVWLAGRQMVKDGQHIQHNEIEQKYRSIIVEIRQ